MVWDWKLVKPFGDAFLTTGNSYYTTGLLVSSFAL
jgi:hypothetical protein